MENEFISRARENTIRARAGVGTHELNKGIQGIEAVGGGKRMGHPFESGMVVAEGVDGGGVVEEVKIEVRESWVVADMRLEESDEVLRCERRFEMKFDEMAKTGYLGLRGRN